MKIKRFGELNEANKSNKQKALDAGYNYGDIVFNKVMKKNIIIADEDMPVSEYVDDYCSIESVGENLDYYQKSGALYKQTKSGKVHRPVEMSIEDYLEKNLKSDERDIFDNNDRLVLMSDVIKVVKQFMNK